MDYILTEGGISNAKTLSVALRITKVCPLILPEIVFEFGFKLKKNVCTGFGLQCLIVKINTIQTHLGNNDELES